MLRNLTCAIKIGSVELDFVHEVEITSGWTERTDIAIIRLAKSVFIKKGDLQRQTIDKVIKAGDKVEIRLGYDNNLKLEFKGYVATSPAPKIPLEIYCEDEMYMLKRKAVGTKTFVNADVTTILRHIAPEYTSDVLNSRLGTFIIGKNGIETAAQVLERLESEAGLRSFFRLSQNGSPVLVVGKPHLWGVTEDKPELGEVTYHLQKNVVDNSLKYVSADDRRIRVDARLVKEDGSTVKAKFSGDVDGEVRTLHYYGITEDQLEKNARADYLRFKRDGFDGDITGFGIPWTQSGQVVRIIDEMYEQRDRRFFIDKVKVTFGQSGFRRANTIGFAL